MDWQQILWGYLPPLTFTNVVILVLLLVFGWALSTATTNDRVVRKEDRWRDR